MSRFLATVLALAASYMFLFSLPAIAATIPFDTLVMGATSFSYDGDGDLVNDVIFSTTDPSGFNTFGPGLNMTYINEPGLEGTSLLSPDLRVDFLHGASGNLSFGFAQSGRTGGVDGVTFNIYDAGNNLLASTFDISDFTSPGGGTSSFPEAFVNLGFSGIAAYATFNFTAIGLNATRYIIDDFSGTFGSTETIIPVPATAWLFGSALLMLSWIRRRKAA